MSQRYKIYLSKSKQGDFNTLMKIKGILASFDIEVLEFSGGTYTTELLDSSDYIFVLPPSLSTGRLGRGQTDEILRGLDRDIPVYCVADYDEGDCDLVLLEIFDEHLTFLKKDWQSNWAEVELEADEDDYVVTSDLFCKPLKTSFSKALQDLEKSCQEPKSVVNKETGEIIPVCAVKKKSVPMLATITLFKNN